MLLDLKVIKNYAQVLFKSATELSKENQVLAEVSVLASLMQQAESFKEALRSPIVDRAVKRKLIDLIAAKYKFEAISKQFLYILIKNERCILIPQIASMLEGLIQLNKGIKIAEVTSAFKLTEREIEIIKQFLESELGKKIELLCSIDTSLIGGAVIKYDSNLIDCSVQGALDRIEKVAIGSKI